MPAFLDDEEDDDDQLFVPKSKPAGFGMPPLPMNNKKDNGNLSS